MVYGSQRSRIKAGCTQGNSDGRNGAGLVRPKSIAEAWRQGFLTTFRGWDTISWRHLAATELNESAPQLRGPNRHR